MEFHALYNEVLPVDHAEESTIFGEHLTVGNHASEEIL